MATTPSASTLGHAAQAIRLKLLTKSVGHSEERTSMLVIAGVDSDTHPPMQAILKYAILDSHDLKSPVLKPHESALDDSVMLFQGSRLTFLNSLVHEREMANIPPSAALQVLSEDELSTADSEATELYKILAFVDLVAPHRSLCMPLGLTAGVAPARILETWPLVQAFALQDLGPGGFFTQRMQVEDVQPFVADVLAHVDSAALTALTRPGGGAAQVGRQWRAFEALVSGIRNLGRRATVLTCEAVAEPLVSFADFSRMHQHSGPDEAPPSHATGILASGARLLVGRFTGQDAVDPVSAASACSSLPLSQCGTLSLPPLHAVAEVSHPCAGLAACRTVFLSGGRGGGAGVQQAMAVLGTVYEEVIAAVVDAMPGAARLLLDACSDEEAAALCVHHLLATAQGMASAAGGQGGLTLSAGVRLVTVSGQEVAYAVACSNTPSSSTPTPPTPTPSSWRPRRLAYMKLSVGGIKGGGGEDIGSVAYGDTVLVVGMHSGGSYQHAAQPFAQRSAHASGIVLLPTTWLACVPHSKGQFRAQEQVKGYAKVMTAGILCSLQWTASCTPVPFLAGPGDLPLSEPAALQMLADNVAGAVEAAAARSSLKSSAAEDGPTPRYGRGVGKGFSSVQHPHTERTGSRDPEMIVAGVPTAERKADSAHATIGALIAQLGKPVGPTGRAGGATSQVTLLSGGSLVPFVCGGMQVFERGVVLALPGQGPLVLSAAAHLHGAGGGEEAARLIHGEDALDAAAKSCLGVAGQALLFGAGSGAVHDAVRAAQAGWLDSRPAQVELSARAAVDAAVLQVSSIGRPAQSTGAMPSVTDSAMRGPQDVVVMRLKHVAATSPATVLAGRLSCISALSHPTYVGILLPPEGDMRAAVMEALPQWRRVAAEADSENERSTGEALMGNLPACLLPGYLSRCTAAGCTAWIPAWEGEHLAELMLHEDGGENVMRSGLHQAGDTQNCPAVNVTVITGVAGSGTLAIASSIINAVGGRSGGLPLLLADASGGREGQEEDSQQDVRLALQRAVASLNVPTSTADMQSKPIAHILLVAPPHASTADSVQAIGGVCCGKGGEMVTLSMHGTIVCMNSRQVKEDVRGARFLPHLLESAEQGWCGALLVLAPADKDAMADALQVALRRVNQHVMISRLTVGVSASLGIGGRVAVSHGMATSLLAECGKEWGSPRSRAARDIYSSGKSGSADGNTRILHVYAPEEAGQAGGATIGSGPVSRRILSWLPVPPASSTSCILFPALEEALVLECFRRLVVRSASRPDLALLGDKLMSIPGLPVPLPASGTTPAGTVYAAAWHVSGLLRIVQSQKGKTDADSAHVIWSLMAVEATPYSVRLTTLPDGEVPASAAPSVRVTGVGMHLVHVAAGIRDMLLQCRPRLQQPLMQRGAGCIVTARERVGVARANASVPLPPDCIFDGRGYWNMTGDALPENPLTTHFAARFLAVHDAAVCIFNRLCSRLDMSHSREAGSVDKDAAVLDWPIAEDEDDARLALPSLPLGLPLADITGHVGTEEMRLPLPPPASRAWWEQQERCAAWVAQTLRTVIAE